MRKRITMLLASLLLCVGAWAQTPIKHADFDSNKNYRVYSTSRNDVAYAIAPNDAANKGVMAEYDATALNQVWQFIPGTGDNEGKYLLYNISTRTYLGYVWGANGVALYSDVNNSDVGYYEIGKSESNDEYFTFYHSGGDNQRHWLHNEVPSLNGWNGNGHEFFYLEEVTEEFDYVSIAKEELNTLLEDAQEVYNGLVNKEFAEAVALNAAISAAQNVYDAENAELEEVNEQITQLTVAKNAVEPYPFVESAIKTIEAGKYFIYYTDESSVKHYLQTSGSNSVVTVTDNPVSYDIAAGTVSGGKYTKAYTLKMNNLYISNTSLDATNIETKTAAQLWSSQVIFEKDGKAAIRLTNATAVDGWHGNYFINKGETEGATIASDPSLGDALFFWTIEEVTAVAELEALVERIEAMGITSGTNIGDYTAASVTALNDAIAAAKDIIDEETATDEDIATLQAAYDALAIVLPSTDKVYALNSYKQYLYQKIDGSSTSIFTGGTEITDPKALWQFVAVDGGYNIKNVHTNMFIGSNVQMTADENNYALFEITKNNYENGAWGSAGDGKVFIKFAGDTYNCLHSNASTVISWSGNGDGNKVAVEEVAVFSHTLTIDEYDYMTLTLGFNAEVPEGVTAYKVTGTEDKELVLESVGNVIPAGEPVIIYAEVAEGETKDAEFAYTTTEVTKSDDNLLKGTLIDGNVAPTEGYDAYVMALNGSEVVMGKAMLNVNENTQFKNRANKAYLELLQEVAAGAPMFSFGRGEGTTGIENSELNIENPAFIYDLLGRRVEKMEKGIYIVNGKKVIR